MTTPGPTTTQLLAASAAIIQLERIASSGVLPEGEEHDVRLLILRVCRAFELPSIAERSQGDNVFELVKTPTVYRR